jgi:hypothetical protein
MGISMELRACGRAARAADHERGVETGGSCADDMQSQGGL